MLRIYDRKKMCWIKDGVYLSINNDLVNIKKYCLGSGIKLLSDNRYICHQSIGLSDMKNKLIFEGDIVRFKYGENTGIVTYVSELAAYVILDYDTHKYYNLSNKICSSAILVIGNVFDTPEYVPAKMRKFIEKS